MLIELADVSVQRHATTVLEDINLRLSEHRIGLVGANGSGKSTLVRLFNGLVQASTGTVNVNGLNPAQNARELRRQVGFVFQNPDNQIVMPRVAEDLAFGLRNLKVSAAEIPGRIHATLQQLGIEHLSERLCHELSGGEKQLVALAAVLVMQPQVLVFDEPTTLLDLRNRNRLGRTLAALSQPAVVVSHDLDWLADFDRILVLEQGRVVADDAPGPALSWYRRQQS